MYSVSFRKAVLLLYEHFKSMRKTASVLKVSIASISRWCKSINPIQRKQSYLHNRELLTTFIERSIFEKPCMTARELKGLISDTLNISVSLSLIYVVIKNSGFSFKRARKRGITSQNEERKIEFKRHYKSVNGLLVSIDESGFHHAPSPVYGWSKKGKQLILRYSDSRSNKRVSLLMAISNDGNMRHTLHTESIDSVRFAEFILSLPYPHGTTLVMDNASFHKTNLISLICSKKGYYILFTPPYTPEFNAIELVFGNIKSRYYKLRFQKNEKIDEMINQCINCVSGIHIKSAFNHVVKKIDESI